MDTTEATDPRAPLILLRADEVAKFAKIGRSTVYQLIAAGTIPSVRFGRSVRVPMEALRRWLERATR